MIKRDQQKEIKAETNPTETVTGKAWKQKRTQKEEKGKHVKTKP